MLMDRGVSIALYRRQYVLKEPTNFFMSENEDTASGSVQVMQRARTSCVNRPAALVGAEGKDFVVAGRWRWMLSFHYTHAEEGKAAVHYQLFRKYSVSLSSTQFSRPENLH
jgi:hypothetical protein